MLNWVVCRRTWSSRDGRPRGASFAFVMGAREIRQAIDWGELGPLRFRARQVAEGAYAGLHRSALRGAGVEFGGYREYVAGDDLRRLDRRSLLRHQRLLVRQFETETDRALCLVVDTSASMAFRSPRAKGSKIAFAAIVAAALARIAIVNGDPVSVTFAGDERVQSIARSSGREQFERIIAALETLEPGGDAFADPGMLDRALLSLARVARRGAIVVVLSDLLDWASGAAEQVASLASSGRVLAVVQTLDPAEVDFPFSGTVRLRALEGGRVVETDADATRAAYLAALGELSGGWRESLARRGGRFLSATTGDSMTGLVRSIVQTIR
jgi:uncharacterized protein (DUF58 family)